MLDGDFLSIQWPQNRRKIVWLLFSFSPSPTPPSAPPTSATVKPNWHWCLPISQLSADKAQDLHFHFYSAWYVSGSSCRRGWTGRFPPYVGGSYFLKELGLTRPRAKGTHLVAHDLACHNPSSPALILKQQIPHRTNHSCWCSSDLHLTALIPVAHIF